MEKTIKGFIQALSTEKYQAMFPADKENHVFFIYNAVRETTLFEYLYDQKIDQSKLFQNLLKL